MSILQLCDEQQYIFKVNEEFKSIPIKISYSMEFLKSFSPDELSFAVNECIKTADVFAARCVVKDGRQYMEFLQYQKQHIPVFDFSTQEEYQMFCKKVRATKINNRDKLFYIFIFSIAGSYYHLHFTVNHLIYDGISVLLLSEKIQKVLINKNEEIKWYPFSDYLERKHSYNESERYLIDKEFWEDRFLEISKCQYLFSDIAGISEASVRSLSFQTSEKFKEDINRYCAKNNISPHILIATVLAQKMNEKTGCDRFYFEIPMGNRSGPSEKNSIGIYEISPPFIFDFTKYNNIFDLIESIKKQSMAYYIHNNFDWNAKIYSESYERKYGSYIPQVLFSYFCYSKEPSVSFATLHHYCCETDIVPMNLYISDYQDWQTMTFSYMFWENYFTDQEVIEIHNDIETKIANIVENKINTL